MPDISLTELSTLCTKALSQASIKTSDISDILDHYLENEYSGKRSHGLVRIVEAIKAVKKYGLAKNNPETEADTGQMIRINANRAIGVVAGKYTTDLSIERTKQHGMSLAGVRNYIASMGSMTYFLRRFTQNNLIAIMGCNSVAMVAPHGGCERMIGTNPLGIAIPGKDGNHMIADLATSAIAYGKIMVAKDQGHPIPDGTMVNKDGYPSNNPDDAYNGAILPLAGHKGFAIGLMIELLAGPLIGANASKKTFYDNDGMFIIAIDPTKIAGDHYLANIAETLQSIKSSKAASGEHAIFVPGEQSQKTLGETIKRGYVNVADKTLNDLRGLANE